MPTKTLIKGSQWIRASEMMKVMRGRGKQQVHWKEHVKLILLLHEMQIGVREMSRRLHWSVGKCSEDLDIGLTLNLDTWDQSRRAALRAIQRMREEQP